MSRENWFFALPVDGAFVLELPPLPPNFRRFQPEDVHVTLCFLGPCGEAAAHLALAELDARSQEFVRPAIEVRLGTVVPMGARRAYSALSALLSEGREATESLIASLRDPLAAAAGAPREQRAPKAHVTVARPSRRATPAERRAGLAWAGACELQSVTARLDRVCLYRWSEDRAARMFRIAAERPFRAP
ncbi:MAG TPA: 2'-5' RNA ligase family protein [Polyangiaceae bacterium]|nr:2'-5' RNA ligase family protein [Polyangiaceae bacterium]